MKYKSTPQSNAIFQFQEADKLEEEKVQVSRVRKPIFNPNMLPDNTILTTSEGAVLYVMNSRVIVLEAGSGAREWLSEHPFMIWPTKKKFNGAGLLDVIPAYEGLDVLFKLAFIG